MVVAASETTIDPAGTTTHTQVVTTFQFTVTVGTVIAQDNQDSVQAPITEWVMSPTTIKLSFVEIITYVQLTEAIEIVVSIPSGYTHLIIDDIKHLFRPSGIHHNNYCRRIYQNLPTCSNRHH